MKGLNLKKKNLLAGMNKHNTRIRKQKCPLICYDISLSLGSARLNANTNGKIVARMLVYFVLTSLINAILGTVLVLSIHPGDPHRKVVLGKENIGRKARILDGILDLGRWVTSSTCN
jgi:Na+/H+-dicarboxylate symporter